MDALKDFMKMNQEMCTVLRDTSQSLFNRLNERQILMEKACTKIKKNKNNTKQIKKLIDDFEKGGEPISLFVTSTFQNKKESKNTLTQTKTLTNCTSSEEDVNSTKTNILKIKDRNNTRATLDKGAERMTRARTCKLTSVPKILSDDTIKHNQKKNDLKSTSKETGFDIFDSEEENDGRSIRTKTRHRKNVKRVRSPSENTPQKNTAKRVKQTLENSEVTKVIKNNKSKHLIVKSEIKKPVSVKIEKQSNIKASTIVLEPMDKRKVIDLIISNSEIPKPVLDRSVNNKVMSKKHLKDKVILEKQVIVKVTPLSKDLLKRLAGGEKIKFSKDGLIINEHSMVKDVETITRKEEELVNQTTVIKNSVNKSILKNKSTHAVNPNITNTPVHRTTRTKMRNLLAKGDLEEDEVFGTPVKMEATDIPDSDDIITATPQTFIPICVSTLKIDRILPSEHDLESSINEKNLHQLDLKEKREEEERVKKLEKERERILLEKQKEAAEKRRLLAKERSEKRRKIAEEIRAAEEERLRKEKSTKALPVYMTEKAPHLPTYDCYDSDDLEREKVDVAPKRPEWIKGDAFLRTLNTMLVIDNKFKNSLFCPAPVTPDLQEIFENIDPGKLRRNSSAIWMNQSKLHLTIHSIKESAF